MYFWFLVAVSMKFDISHIASYSKGKILPVIVIISTDEKIYISREKWQEFYNHFHKIHMANRNVKKIVLKGVSVSHNYLHVYYYLQSIPAMPLCWGFKVLQHDITCSSNKQRNKIKFTHYSKSLCWNLRIRNRSTKYVAIVQFDYTKDWSAPLQTGFQQQNVKLWFVENEALITYQHHSYTGT